MKKTTKVAKSLVIVCVAALAAVSTFAVSEVRCTGGGGSRPATHKYGIFGYKSHEYTEYYHDVDRVYNNVIYGTDGHDDYDCDETDFMNYCEPGTVVGWG